MRCTVFTCNGRDIPLEYKPSLRAKRLSLRLSSKDASLILTIPFQTTQTQINSFLQHCTPWVHRQLKRVEPKILIGHGETLTLHGTPFQCVVDPLRRKPALCEMTKTLFLSPRYGKEDLYAVFKKVAVEKLMSYILKAASHVGKKVEKVTIRDPKSRWGSCSAGKTISLSWRLILAPPEVAYYVCAHEVAHLIYMNHSKEFWRVVGELCPAYRTHCTWLKINGPSLMRI